MEYNNHHAAGSQPDWKPCWNVIEVAVRELGVKVKWGEVRRGEEEHHLPAQPADGVCMAELNIVIAGISWAGIQC